MKLTDQQKQLLHKAINDAAGPGRCQYAVCVLGCLLRERGLSELRILEMDEDPNNMIEDRPEREEALPDFPVMLLSFLQTTWDDDGILRENREDFLRSQMRFMVDNWNDQGVIHTLPSGQYTFIHDDIVFGPYDTKAEAADDLRGAKKFDRLAKTEPVG